MLASLTVKPTIFLFIKEFGSLTEHSGNLKPQENKIPTHPALLMQTLQISALFVAWPANKHRQT